MTVAWLSPQAPRHLSHCHRVQGRAAIAATVEEFLTAAKDCEADIEVIDIPLGHHGFETVDHTDQASRAVDRAVRSVLGHLRS
ncbi:MAG: hypothetical protein JWL99_1493 [Streptomyces oryziradicis]|nr:hypothetical protein [Actinacidiphila oryziradicis]